MSEQNSELPKGKNNKPEGTYIIEGLISGVVLGGIITTIGIFLGYIFTIALGGVCLSLGLVIGMSIKKK